MKKYQSFLSENFQFLEVKFSIYLNRYIFVMNASSKTSLMPPYSSTVDIFFIHERFNKLIYGINMIIKCGIWQPVKFQIVSRFLTGSKMK